MPPPDEGSGRVRLDPAQTGQCGTAPNRPKARPIKVDIALPDALSCNAQDANRTEKPPARSSDMPAPAPPADRRLAAQVRDLTAAGAERIFSEQVSSVASRARLTECLAFLRDGDVLAVTSRRGLLARFRTRGANGLSQLP